MVRSCSAIGCTNRDTQENCGCLYWNKGVKEGIKLYRIPVKPDKCRLWLATMRRKDFNPPSDAAICSVYFVEGDSSFPHVYLNIRKFERLQYLQDSSIECIKSLTTCSNSVYPKTSVVVCVLSCPVNCSNGCDHNLDWVNTIYYESFEAEKFAVFGFFACTRNFYMKV